MELSAANVQGPVLNSSLSFWILFLPQSISYSKKDYTYSVKVY